MSDHSVSMPLSASSFNHESGSGVMSTSSPYCSRTITKSWTRMLYDSFLVNVRTFVPAVTEISPTSINSLFVYPECSADSPFLYMDEYGISFLLEISTS